MLTAGGGCCVDQGRLHLPVQMVKNRHGMRFVCGKYSMMLDILVASLSSQEEKLNALSSQEEKLNVFRVSHGLAVSPYDMIHKT